MKFFTFATAGMVSASGGGVFFGFVVTPGMLLMVIGTLTGGVVPSVPTFPAAAVVMTTLPLLAPGGRPAVCATARSVWPPGGTMPLAGVTMIQGTVGSAEKLSPASSAGMFSVYATSAGSLNDATPPL